MTIFTVICIFEIIFGAILGIVVFAKNWRRTTNQYFMVLSFILSLWLVPIAIGFASSDKEIVMLCIKSATALAATTPLSFHLLRLSIKYQSDSFLTILKRAVYWLCATVFAMIICWSPIFLFDVYFVASKSQISRKIPEPEYGPGIILYAVYFIVSIVLLIIKYTGDIRKSKGLQRLEFHFILLGSGVSLFVGVLVAVILPIVTGSSQTVELSPFATILFSIIIAYGIATRRIMEVSEILRRATAYGLLSIYLILLYLVVWFVVSFLLKFIPGIPSQIPGLVAALILAFSMTPARGHLQQFANRLFVNFQPMDVAATMQSANKILHSIATLDELLGRFSECIAGAVGTDRILILLEEKNKFVEHYPSSQDAAAMVLNGEHVLIKALEEHKDPILLDTIKRYRANPVLDSAGEAMKQLNVTNAIGIYSKGVLEGMMLLGTRLSGRVYSAMEQDTLQLLCNQLAVSLENAKLYTQLQDSKVYNDILLENLVSGVVAVDVEGVVTVFNKEAQRIIDVPADDILNTSYDHLPEPLVHILQETLEERKELRDQEVTIECGEEDEVQVRIGSSVFRKQSGDILGALIVFHDVTAMKKLEMQVRRTDRLASIGTLAAGMAHEIKNPLVSIKTFTQLLPERYEDQDFRDTFSSLVGDEVKRIDAIVNHLLNFSRPSKPLLTPMHVHDILDQSLHLIGQQLVQKRIVMNRWYGADYDLIEGDPDQLKQVFINFLMNAIDAMRENGNLMVSTKIVSADTIVRNDPNVTAHGEAYIQVGIKDTGVGISEEQLAHIFDPFFTQKSNGTGLGLTVTHGIIQEHNGVIDVESEVNKGTTFRVSIPLIPREAVDV